jgi:hypothetical protein
VRDLISEACAFGSRIDKGLIDDQQPASPPQAIREREQCVLGDDPAIGIVGIDDNGDAGVCELRNIGDLDHVMTGKLRCARMLGISRGEHRHAAARQEEAHLRHEDLRAWRRDHTGSRRRPIGPSGDLLELEQGGRLRQAREEIRRKVRHGIRMGIDPSRQVEERFGRTGK